LETRVAKTRAHSGGRPLGISLLVREEPVVEERVCRAQQPGRVFGSIGLDRELRTKAESLAEITVSRLAERRQAYQLIATEDGELTLLLEYCECELDGLISRELLAVGVELFEAGVAKVGP
jgi:hypothetical protein